MSAMTVDGMRELDFTTLPRLSVYKEPWGWEWMVLRPVVGAPWYWIGLDGGIAATHGEALAVGLAALEAASVGAGK